MAGLAQLHHQALWRERAYGFGRRLEPGVADTQ
jgi:hypothetical protein